MTTHVDFDYSVGRSVAEVEACLLDTSFLDAFVDLQHPVTKDITVDAGARRSTVSWTVRLDGDLPELVTRFVGREAQIGMVFDLASSTLSVNVAAKRNARGDLRLAITELPTSGAGLTISGNFTVDGMFGSLAEPVARDQVLKPVIEEDLIPLLESWTG